MRIDDLAPTLLSPLLWIVIAVVALLWVPLLLVILAFTARSDPGRYAVGRWFRRIAVIGATLYPPWTFRISGVRIADPRRPYIVVANHESFADIVLLSHLPWEMKWLSKRSMFEIPLMGWLMRLAGDIEVRRRDPESRSNASREIHDRLSKKVSVMIFPEGTRSVDGGLRPFQNGAFRIAIEAGVPVLPVAVAGTREAIAKGSLRCNRSRAEARVLAPIPTDGLTLEDVPELRDRVRRSIARARDDLRRELARR